MAHKCKVAAELGDQSLVLQSNVNMQYTNNEWYFQARVGEVGLSWGPQCYLPKVTDWELICCAKGAELD